MKKLIAFVSAFVICIFSVSCSAKKENFQNTDYNENIFSYNLQNTCAFTAENDSLYVADADSNLINCYNLNGEKTDSYDFGEGFHTNLSYCNNVLYSFTYGDTGNSIIAYDISENKKQEHKIETDISSVIAMTVLNNKIFMVYWSEDSDEYLESVQYSDDDNYVYMGEKAIAIDTETFETEEIHIDNVLNLKPYSENEIIYYAYDDIGGYYFTIYNINSKTFSEKKYNNTASHTFSFECYNDNIIYSDFGRRKISSFGLDDTECVIDFMPNVAAVSGNDLKFDNGNCYVYDNFTGNILRTKYDDAVKDNKEIKFVSTELDSEIPYSCGYRINTKMLERDKFALNILAENSDYDICMMSSAQTFSGNIRDKGAFYKLNDVPMVKEYLDKCFPYLNNAAHDKNDDIWMIPIAVNIPCIVFNPENCEKNRIEISEKTSWNELFDICRNTYENNSIRDKFSVNGYQAQYDILSRYTLFHSNKNDKILYNTDLFKNVCSLLKDTNIDSDFLHTWIIGLDQYDSLNEYYNDYLFELLSYSFDSFYEEAFNSLRAIPTPSINNENKSCAECIYFCVNANSDNLSDALNFISSYCSYMLGRNDTYVFKDKNVYQFSGTNLANDLYSVYSNAEICFTPSEEMFWDDYLKYVDGQISVDELAVEIERKTNMYMNE